MDAGGALLVASYAFVSGYSDGALTTPAVRLRILPPVPAILTMALAAGFTPLLLGDNIAETLAARLLPAQVDSDAYAVVIVLASSTTALALAALRVPTSLGLALLAAIGGYTVGAGGSSDAALYLFVIIAAAIAPIVGGLLAAAQLAMVASLQRAGLAVKQFAGWAQVAYFAQCGAYGANDGQRMLAVALLAGGAWTNPVSVAVLVTVAFFIGALTGVTRSSKSMTKIVGIRPEDAAAATSAATATSFAGAALGLPLSLSQALSGGLAGAGITRGGGRVRWRAASNIVISWFVTMPAAAIPAGFAGWWLS